MGWETRGNGSYYYRKVRDGGRVRSEYLGAGVVAELLAEVDDLDRQRRQLDAEEWQDVIDAERRHDSALAEVDDMVRTMSAAVLIAAGLHTHGRQWRRQR